MRRSLILILFLLLAGLQNGFSQATEGDEARSGSVYSGFGIGMPSDMANAEIRAMGIIGVSYNYLFTPGLNNPAFWSRGRLTRGTAGFNMASYNVTSPTASDKNTIFEAGFVNIVFPLIPNELGVSAALYPYTRQNYRVLSREVINQGTPDSLAYAVNNQGFGGVNKLEFGIGWSPVKNLSIGYAPSLVFVTNTRTELFIFDPSADLTNTSVDNILNGYTLGHRFGLLYTLESIRNDEDYLQFGATYTPALDIKLKRKQEVQKSVGANATILVDLLGNQSSNGNLRLPHDFAAGVTYFASPLFNVSLEGQLQQWSGFENELNPGEEQFLTDRLRIGSGFQYHPYKTNINTFLSNFKYSAGVSYDSGHLNINNEKIQTLWLSGGIGLFSPRNFSSFDLAVQYGIRGESSNNLIRENILAISLSINLTELFFNRPKLN
ncbi:hypothetical protein AB2B38_010490 [Balneola sp. MJW-20]|uniref:hypothetical protein n=1 Tax=Gracilimonas aurantiaca TaxID=3234185 RepID=UPI003467906B